MVLAALLFIRRVADTTTVTAVTDEYVRDGHVHSLQHHELPPYVRIFRIHGPFLFGATDKLRVVVHDVSSLPEIVVLRLRNMTALDATGLRAIEELADLLHRSGRDLILCGARHQPSEPDRARRFSPPRRRRQHLREHSRRARTRAPPARRAGQRA